MLRQEEQVLEFRDGPADPGVAHDLAPAAPCAAEPPSGPVADRPDAPSPHAWSRTQAIVEVDDALRVVAELLELLKHKTMRGSQAGILLEGAAMATERASRLAKSLLAEE